MESMNLHKEQGKVLARLAESEDFPHILLYGPSGAGKRTLTKCLLQALYKSPNVHKIKSEHKEFRASSTSSTMVDCVVFSSNFHLEVTPSEADSHDRIIVQKLIKEVAGSQQLDAKVQKSFKIVVIHEIDNLTNEAQAALRRTMETYMPYCRIVANAESLSRVIMPVRSRCLQIRVPAPTNDEIGAVLKSICVDQKIDLPPKLSHEIAHASNRNLRKAIMMLQSVCLKTNAHPTDRTTVPVPEYESFVKEIVMDTLKEQSPKNLRHIRTKLYELLTKGITAEIIFLLLVRFFMKRVDQSLQKHVLKYATIFEHRCKAGSKAIMHIEAYLARMMATVKAHQVNHGRR